MATGIEWTNETWNPLVGCSMVSPGCAHCYAETMSKRLKAMAEQDVRSGRNPGRKAHYMNVINEAGKWNGKISLVEESLLDPMSWKKPRRVFVNSMSDLFHEDVPFEFIDLVFAVMTLTPQHTYQVLTKRPERMAEYLTTEIPLSSREEEIAWNAANIGKVIWDPRGSDVKNYYDIAGGTRGQDFSNRRVWAGWPLPNCWAGTSVEDQQRADERIPHLLRCPAAVRFLSCEPMLGPIDLKISGCAHMDWDGDEETTWGKMQAHDLRGKSIHWIICGGESGPHSRPCNIDWIRSIVGQCKAAGVPVFVKQLGNVVRVDYYHDDYSVREWGSDGNSETWGDSGNGRDHFLWADPYVDGQPRPGSYFQRHLNSKGGDMSEWPEDLRVREFPATQ